MNPDDFAIKIKEKYPQYMSVDNKVLAQKMVEKYPAYAEQVNFDTQSAAEKGKLFTSALKKQTEGTKEQFGQKSLAYAATAPARAVIGAGARVADFFTSGTQEFGSTIGQALGAKKSTKQFEDSLAKHSQISNDIIARIRQKKAQGGDVTRLEDALQKHAANQPTQKRFTGEVIDKTAGQVMGEAAMTGLETLTGGLAKPVSSTAKLASSASKAVGLSKQAYKALPLSQKLGKVGMEAGKNIAQTLPFGYAADVSLGLTGDRGEKREGTKAFIPGLGSGLSIGLPLAVGGYKMAAPIVKSRVQKILPKMQAKEIDHLENVYNNIMEGTIAGKRKKAKIDAKVVALDKSGTTGKLPQRKLAEDGIIPNIKGTKLDTLEQSFDYQKRASKLQEVNKTALKEISENVKPISINKLEEAAVANARSGRNIASGRASKMEGNIRKEFAILRNEYGDSLPLEKLDEIKSARWDNVFKNKGLVDVDVLAKDSEYAIAKALQKEIEAVAAKSGNSNVAQLNREIGDVLEASKYLEGLDGKTLKGGRLLKYVTTIIGATTSTTVPGRIVGALGGNMLGQILISAQVSNPKARLILNTLKKNNPKAYTDTVEWLQKQNSKKTQMLLDAPKKGLPEGGVMQNTTKNLSPKALPTQGAVPRGLGDEKGIKKSVDLFAGKTKAELAESIAEMKSLDDIAEQFDDVTGKFVPENVKKGIIEDIENELIMREVILDAAEDTVSNNPVREALQGKDRFLFDSEGRLLELGDVNTKFRSQFIEDAIAQSGAKDSKDFFEKYLEYQAQKSNLSSEKATYKELLNKYKKATGQLKIDSANQATIKPINKAGNIPKASTKTGVKASKGVDNLVNEAKKYKSADEFVEAQFKKGYRAAHQIDSKTASPVSDIKGDTLDSFVDEFKRQYGYPALKSKELNNIKRIMADSGGSIKVYRASPAAELNTGDWVTIDRSYANDIKKQNGGKVFTHEVKVGDLFYPNTLEGFKELPSLNKWGAFQFQSSDEVAKLTDIWKQASPKKELPQGKTPASASKGADKFVNEAKKYKSADEFVKAQGKPVYHGSKTKIDSFEARQPISAPGNFKGIYFAEDVVEARDYGDVVTDVYLDIKKPLVGNPYEEYAKTHNIKNQFSVKKADVEKWMKEQGYDGIIRPKGTQYNLEGAEFIVFNPNQIKTKSQLEDIWKQANK